MPSVYENEWLLIKSDRLKDWRKGDFRKCLPTIRDEQSCWAQPGPAKQELVLDVDRPHTALHALNLFLLQELQGSQSRTQVKGLSISREVVDQYVKAVDDDHLISGLETTHRELHFPSESARESAVMRMVASTGQRGEWEFTIDVLLPLLRRVLDAGVVNGRFVGIAETILKRYSGS